MHFAHSNSQTMFKVSRYHITRRLVNTRICGNTYVQKRRNITSNSKFSLLSYACEGLVSKLVVDSKMAKCSKQHGIE